MLEEYKNDPRFTTWRKDQVPVWTEILREAELRGEARRAAYARWILTEVLGADLPAADTLDSTVSLP